MGFYQILRFLVCKNTRFCNESHAERDLERERSAAAGRNVDGQFGVLPKFELVLGHIKIAARDLAQPNIAAAHDELALRITHRRRPVTAPAGLVKHQLAVFRTELLDDLRSSVSYLYPRNLNHLFTRRLVPAYGLQTLAPRESVEKGSTIIIARIAGERSVLPRVIIDRNSVRF